MNVLVVDDNPADRALAERALLMEFPQARVVTDVQTLEDLEQRLAATVFDAAVIDYRLRWSDGITVLKKVLGQRPDCACVLFTASGNEEVAAAAMRAGADDYVIKNPSRMRLLGNAVRWSLERAATRKARREAEQALARSVAELREANAVKDEFLANVSHELRSPLSAIGGWAALMRLGGVRPEEIPGIGELIERNVKVQADIIADLLDISRLAAGTVRLSMRRVELGALVVKVMESVRPAVEQKGLRLVRDLQPVPPVLGDATRLQQVVRNLLDNAIKFTPAKGEIRVQLRQAGASACLTVADSGEGIARESLPLIFERFNQADNRGAAAKGGVGLGLSIARQLAQLHGGTISATSPGKGQGATFVVELPLAGAGAPALPAAEHAPGWQSDRLAGQRILLVDDDAQTLEVVGKLIAAAGGEVDTAASVAEALRKLEAFKPTVVVSDIGMPGQDGYSLAARLRGRVPAIALSAYAAAADRVRAEQAGFAAHLAKPVDPEALVTTIRDAVRDR